MMISSFARKLPVSLAAAWVVMAPVLAHAHPGHSTSGFAAGALHPVTGLDHLAAMVAVGLWAVQLGGRARWMLPLAFVGMMAAGIGLGKLGLQIPLAESMIAGSVLLLGALIAFAVRLPVAVCAVLAGFFAIFHGYAHGVEGAGYSGGLYLSGVLLATLVLHAVGIAAAAGMRRIETIPALRLAGGCVAAVGLALIAA